MGVLVWVQVQCTWSWPIGLGCTLPKSLYNKFYKAIQYEHRYFSFKINFFWGCQCWCVRRCMFLANCTGPGLVCTLHLGSWVKFHKARFIMSLEILV